MGLGYSGVSYGFHRILSRLRTIVALAFAIVLFSQIISLPYNDFSLYDKGSVQPALALDQDQINKLKEDLQIIGAIQNVGTIAPGEILVQSTKCPVGSSSTTVDCTKLQSSSERPTDLLATEFIVTIWPTKQNAQRAFDEAEKSAKQNPVSSDEVNKLTAYGFKPSFFQADDRKGFTSAYTSPNEKPEITSGLEYTGVTVASGLVCGTVTAQVSHKTHMISSSAPELQSQYPQQTLIMGFTTVTEIAGEIFDRLLSNNLCGESQVKQAACPAKPDTGVVQSSFSSSRHNNSLRHMNYHPAVVAAEEDRTGVALPNYGNEVEERHTNRIITVADTKSMETTSGPPNSHKFNKWPWKFTYEIVDKQGLVIRGLWAEPRQKDIPEQEILRSLAVPHVEITFLDCKPRIIRFDIKKDIWSGLSPATESSTGKYVIKWGFKKTFDEEKIKGTLSINYDIVINTLPRNNCEKGAGLNCYRFIPKVSYSWSGSPRDVLYFTAFYRLDYGPNAGFALTKDEDSFRKFVTRNLNRQYIQDNETKFIAVEAGDPKGGRYDNIHTVHKDQNVIIPGCARGSFLWGLFGLSGTAAQFKGTPLSRITNVYYPFDCVHMHWRWSASHGVDPMVEPSDDQHVDSKSPPGAPSYEPGTPNLVPGQTIEIGILRVDDKKSIEANDPDDPLYLIDNKKPKQIATTYESKQNVLSKGWGRTTLQSLNDKEGKPVATVVWYVATREKANSDTFFRHGIFIIDPPGGGSLWQNVKTLLSSSDFKEQPYLNDALQKENWSMDGNMLVAQDGERVFNSLSQLATLTLGAKSKTPEAANSADAALAQLLFTVQIIVNNDLLNRVSNTFDLNPTKQTELISLLSSNELVKQSSEKFRTTSNEIDIAKAIQIIGGFKESWINGVQGINQVSTEVTGVPPKGTDTSTTIPVT